MASVAAASYVRCMKTTTKRVLLGCSLLVLVPVVAFVAMMASSFAGNVESTATVLPDGTEPLVLGFVNAFVVPLTTPGAVALIDCGDDVEAKDLKAALAAKQQTVKAIFITHGHPDHIGGCAAFAGVPIYALADEVDAIEGRRAHHSPMSMVRAVKDVGVRVTHPMQDDDSVDVDGVAFHVYAVSGHTAGSAVYRVRSTAFFGDAASSKTDGIGGPVWFFSDNVHVGVASLHALPRRLAAIPGLVTFAFGHTGAVPADTSRL
jgi:glyoxylase-like metal-dependent hydrolase (beta-lactamase superfamily II)